MLFCLGFFALVYVVWKLYSRKTPLKLDKNSVVVITGACNGIGKKTAQELARRHQPKIIILDIMSHKFKEVTQSLEALGSVVTCHKVDLSSEDSIKDVADEIIKSGVAIDLLINNAGIVIPKRFEEQTYRDHQKTMAVNYLAPVYLTLLLKNRIKGHIVTIASIASLLRGNNLSSYVASKHAVYGFFNCLRTECCTYGIKNLTFSLVCPYAINTGMFEGFETKLNKIIPMLDETHVGKIIANTCVNKQQVVFIPFYLGFLVKLLSLLPQSLLDKTASYLDTSDYTNNPALKKKD